MFFLLLDNHHCWQWF